MLHAPSVMLLYLPALAAIHFTASALLGGMSVLSAKALCDMRRGGCVSPPPRNRSSNAANTDKATPDFI